MKIKCIVFLCIIINCYLPVSLGSEVPISLFPLNHYDQHVSRWINADKVKNYNTNLLSYRLQQYYFHDFKKHYFRNWDKSYIESLIIQNSDSIASIERQIIAKFTNQDKSNTTLNYGENFRLQNDNWINTIKANIDFNKLAHLHYNPSNQAILVNNAPARALPTDEASFHRFTLPGEGYPFDNLQISALWAGTPVYIIASSKNLDWMLISTPTLIAWVPSTAVAKVDNKFINQWSSAAKAHLYAITQTKTPIVTYQSKLFYFNAYIGSVFPVKNHRLLFPIKNPNGMAAIKYAVLKKNQAKPMPLSATPKHFADLIKALIGRSYGWGGLYYYNDCSQELRSLFTPFGIWLPRHSSNQANVGFQVDISKLSTTERISYLKQHGHPFMTIVYINGHIFQYIGNYAGLVITYQNMWALKPANHSRRMIVGQSVLFPLQTQYPEDPNLISQASMPIFQLAYLDKFKQGVLMSMQKKEKIDLLSLMLP